MQYSFEPMAEQHRTAVVDIFNSFVPQSFACFLERPVPYEFYDLLNKSRAGLPAFVVRQEDGEIIGFGLLRPHSPMPTYSHTAEISYFILPKHCGKGLGSQLLGLLINEGSKKGIETILACISSLNEGSIRFHSKHGFAQCGCFKEVVKKNGVKFDTVWMQLDCKPQA